MNANQQREHVLLERILILKQIIEEGRGGPVDRHDLAICYYHLENYEKCANQLEQIIKETANYIDISRVYQLLSLTLVRLNQYSEAEKLLKKRLEIESDNVILLNLLAYSYEKLNRPNDAIAVHRRVLGINKDHPNSLNSLGYLLTIHGKPVDLAEAGSHLKAAVKLKPDSPAYLDSLGMYMAKLEHFEAAKKALIKALELDPQNMEIIDHLKEVVQKANKKG